MVRAGDVAMLQAVSEAWFGSDCRLVLRIAREVQPLSEPVLLAAIEDRVDADVREEVMASYLETSLVDDQEFPKHYRALVSRYNSRQVREAVSSAHFRLNDGDSPMRVKHQLERDLSDVLETGDEINLMDAMSEVRQSPNPNILTGMPNLHKIGLDSWLMGNIMTLAADSGSFKTTVATEIVKNALKANPDLHAVYFSKEQQRSEILQKFLAKESSATYSEILAQYNGTDQAYMDKIDAEIRSNPETEYMSRLIVAQSTEFSTIEQMLDILRTHASRHKKIIWVLDYLMQMNFGGEADNLVQRIGQALIQIKEVTHRTGSFGIIISQLVKGWNEDWNKDWNKDWNEASFVACSWGLNYRWR
jgi:replicative DNA helicase